MFTLFIFAAVLPFHVLQKVRRSRKRVLRICKMLIELGDKGPYYFLIESLRCLIAAVNPDRLPSEVRKKARRLRSILKGVLSRIKACAKNEVPGVAQLLYTEVSGHGGLSIFRRLDNSLLDRPGQRPNIYVDQRSSVPTAAPARGGRGRGAAQRGRGGGRRNMQDVTCYNCWGQGHMQNNCPNGPRNPPAPNA